MLVSSLSGEAIERRSDFQVMECIDVSLHNNPLGVLSRLQGVGQIVQFDHVARNGGDQFAVEGADALHLVR